ASSSKVSKINLETQICESESQLNAEKQKVENLLQTTEHYSVELLKCEENYSNAFVKFLSRCKNPIPYVPC
ncbi:unnamed protein product, partial [Schistosoma intercalatum]